MVPWSKRVKGTSRGGVHFASRQVMLEDDMETKKMFQTKHAQIQKKNDKNKEEIVTRTIPPDT